jgi:hypothetical protein
MDSYFQITGKLSIVETESVLYLCEKIVHLNGVSWAQISISTQEYCRIGFDEV